MQTSKWKDIAEIVALFAVVASLIAVVFELRQTQSALRAQAYQSRAFQAYDNHWYMVDRPELLLLFERSLEPGFDLDSVNEAEAQQLFRFYYAILTDVDNEHYQYMNGFLDEDFYNTMTVNDIKVFAPLWRELGISAGRQAFRDEVDRILADDSIEPGVQREEVR